MDASSFEMHLSLPADPRFAPTAGVLATEAARYAGCTPARAEAFGRTVEDAVLGCLASRGSEEVPVTVRRASGPVEVLVDSRRLTLDV
jgi:hypothetical protein